MSIVTAPKEIQLIIFGQLEVSDLVRLSETCHRLKDLARDPSLWKELTLTYNMIKNNTKACREHVGRCSSLRELFIFGQETSIRNDTIINVVLKAKKTLTSLVCSLPLGSSYFKKISMMNQLNNLDLNFANLKSDGITALASLKDLRSLKIFNFCGFYKDLVTLFSSLKNLEEVKFRKCVISDEDVVIESLVVNNSNLHHLDINRGSFPTFPTSLTIRSLDIIADNCHLLTHIDIGNQYVFTNDDLIEFVSKCSKLKYVNFENTVIEDSFLARLASDCRDLEHLNISECFSVTAQGVEAFVNKAAKAKLKYLDISFCGFLTDDYCEPIDSVMKTLQNLEQEHPYMDLFYEVFDSIMYEIDN